ncbi:F-box protein At3g07870-like [Papaver somniferum]|uniref:F-box protein At3g07870-like n=1 Tax=Papaver somniferum TaxID=3469 RepID=UPI000E6F9EA9|nr:F-box protein At3g07870-like [Papaver somniferum]
MNSFSLSSCSSFEKKTGFRFEHIPTEIIEDILARLPAETVLDCKLVCKKWLSVIRDCCFPEKHLHYQLLQFHYFHNHKYYPSYKKNKVTTKIGFIVGVDGTPDDDEYTMVYKEFDDRVITTYRINHHVLCVPGDEWVGSCNGLICIAKYIFNKEVLYVFNPITRKCVYLPRLTLYEVATISHMSRGFGYSATSKKYKDVRILYSKVENSDECLGLVQVYTLGGGSGWRVKETIVHSFNSAHSFISDPGAYVDESLHWLNKERQVWAFDLSDEKFCLLTTLPFSCDTNNAQRQQKLVVLGGWLSVVDIHLNHVDIWSFKKFEEKQKLRSWSKGFSIGWSGLFEVVGLTNKGELLCFRINENICLYSKYSEPICELKETPTIKYGMLHVNSFISIKALEEENVQVIGSPERSEGAISEDELDA